MQRSNSITNLVAAAALTLSGGLAQADVISFDSGTYFNSTFNSFASAAIGTSGADDDKGVILKQIGDADPLTITGSDTGASDSLFREGITNSTNGPLLTAMTMVGFDIDFKFTFDAAETAAGSAILSAVGVTHGGTASVVQPVFDSMTDMAMGSIGISGLMIAPGDSFDVLFTWSLAAGTGTPDNTVLFEITNTPRLEQIAVVTTPEPATLALLGLGFAGLGAARRKKA